MLAGPLPKWLEKRVRDPDTAAIAQAWQQEHDDEVHALTSKLEAFQKDLPPCFHGTNPIIVEGNPGAQNSGTGKKRSYRPDYHWPNTELISSVGGCWEVPLRQCSHTQQPACSSFLLKNKPSQKMPKTKVEAFSICSPFQY